MSPAAAAAPRRGVVAGIVLAAIGALVAYDLVASEPIDYFRAPAPVAFGSGAAAAGAHCAAPPPAAE
jgi:hypothetical protein